MAIEVCGQDHAGRGIWNFQRRFETGYSPSVTTIEIDNGQVHNVCLYKNNGGDVGMCVAAKVVCIPERGARNWNIYQIVVISPPIRIARRDDERWKLDLHGAPSTRIPRRRWHT